MAEEDAHSLLERTSAAIVDSVATPVRQLSQLLHGAQAAGEAQGAPPDRRQSQALDQQLQLQQQAEAPPSAVLHDIARPVLELQRGLTFLQQQALLEASGDTRLFENAGRSILSTLERPFQELQRGITALENQVSGQGSPDGVLGASILEAVLTPLRELRDGIAQVERQAATEAEEDGFEPDVRRYAVLKTLSGPVAELQRAVADVGGRFSLEAAVAAGGGGGAGVAGALLEALERSVDQLTRRAVAVAKLAVLRGQALAETEGLAVLGNLAPPLIKLQKQVIRARNELQLQAGAPEEAAADTAWSAAAAKALSQPLADFRKGLAAVERQLTSESKEEPLQERQIAAALEALANPVTDLLKGIHALQETETCQPEKELLQSFQELQRGLAQVQQVVFETSPELIPTYGVVKQLTKSLQDVSRKLSAFDTQFTDTGTPESEAVSKLAGLAQPMKQLGKGLVQIAQATTSTVHGGDPPTIAPLVQPLVQLQKGLEKMEKQLKATAETIGLAPEKKFTAVIEPIKEMQKGIRTIKRQAILEPQSTSLECLENLIQPIESLRRHLEEIERRRPESPGIRILDEVVSAVEALNIGIESIEKHSTILDTDEKQRLDVLSNLREPLTELHIQLSEVERCSLEGSGRDTVTEIITISALKKLAEPLKEMTKEIEEIDHRLRYGKGDITQIETTLDIKNIVNPVRDLQRSLSAVQQQAILESGVVQDVTGPSILESLFQPLQKLQKSLVTVQARALEGSQMRSSSAVVSELAQSVKSLEREIEEIEKAKIIHANSEVHTRTISLLQALKKPLEEMHISTVSIEQLILEEAEKRGVQSEVGDISVLEGFIEPIKALESELKSISKLNLEEKSAVLSALENLSKPVLELQRTIQTAQQLAVQEAEPVYGKACVSALQILSGPIHNLEQSLTAVKKHHETTLRNSQIEERLKVITDVEKHVQRVHHGAEALEKCASADSKSKIRRKSGLAALGSLCSPLEEVLTELKTAEAKISSEKESVSEVAAVESLKRLSEPLKIFENAVQKVQCLISDPNSEESERAAAVTSLGNAVSDLRQGVAKIYQQAVLESGVGPGTEESSVLASLTAPLHRLQKALSNVEERKMLRAIKIEPSVHKASILVLESISHSAQDIAQEVTSHEKAKDSPLAILAEPLLNLKYSAEQVEQRLVESSVKELPHQATVEILKGIAQPLEELVFAVQQEKPLHVVTVPLAKVQSGIIELQRQTSEEGAAPEKRILIELSTPLAILQQKVNVVYGEVAKQATMKDIPAPETLRAVRSCVDEIKKDIALMENTGQEMSSMVAMETLNQVKENLAQIQDQVLHVAEEEKLQSVDGGSSVLKELTTPVQDLQRGVAIIEEQGMLQADIEAKVAAILHTLARPAQELQRSLERIEQQVHDRAAVSEALPLAQQGELSVEKQTSEIIVSTADEGRYGEEWRESDKEIPHSPMVTTTTESCKQKLEKSSLTIVQAMSQPLKQIQSALSQMEDQPAEFAKNMGHESGVMLATLSQHASELEKSISAIQQQVQLELSELDNSKHTEMVRKLVASVSELQQDLEEVKALSLKSKSAPISHLVEVITEPVCQLQESVATLQHQVQQRAALSETISLAQQGVLCGEEQRPETKTLTAAEGSLGETWVEVDKSVSEKLVATTNEFYEQELKKVSEIILQEMSQPFQHIQCALSQVKEQSAEIARKMSPESHAMFVSLLQHASELEDGISAIEQQLQQESSEFDNTKHAEMVRKLMVSVSELQQTLEEVEVLPLKSKSALISHLVKVITEPACQLQASVAILQKHVQERAALSENISLAQREILSGERQRPEALLSIATERSFGDMWDEAGKAVHAKPKIAAAAESYEQQLEKKSAIILQAMSQPLQQLQIALSQVEKQPAEIAKKISPESRKVLSTLSQHASELEKSISGIEQQVRQESSEFGNSKHGELVRNLVVSVAGLQQTLEEVEVLPFKSNFAPIFDLVKVIAEPVRQLHASVVTLQQHVQERASIPHALSLAKEAALSGESQVSKMPVLTAAEEWCEAEKAVTQIPRVETATESHEQQLEKASVTILQAMGEPLQQIQTALSQIEEQPAEIASKISSEPRAMMATMLQHASELEKDISVIEQHLQLEPSALDAGKHSEMIHNLVGSVAELQQTLEAVEALSLKSKSSPISHLIKVIAEPVHFLQESVTNLQQHVQVRERESQTLSMTHQAVLSGEKDSRETKVSSAPQGWSDEVWDEAEKIGSQVPALAKAAESHEMQLEKASVTVLQALNQPLQQIQSALSEVKEQSAHTFETMSPESCAIFATLSEHATELEKSIGAIEEQVLLEASAHDDRKQAEMVRTLLESVAELRHELEEVEVLPLESKSPAISRLVVAMARPVQELQASVSSLQQNIVVLESVQEPEAVRKRSLESLKTVVAPVGELQHSLSKIQEEMQLKHAQEVATPGLELVESLAAPLAQLQRNLSALEQRVASPVATAEEPRSLLQELVQPLHEMQRTLVAIEQKVALEAEGESGGALLQALAQPAEVVQRGITLVEQQVILEGMGEPLPPSACVSVLAKLADPLAELSRSVALLQQQVILGEIAEPLSEKSAPVETLAQPLELVSLSLAQVELHQLLEAPESKITSASEAASHLRAFADHVQQLEKSIVQVQQQVALEAKGDSISEKTSLSILETLAQPLQEVQQGIATIEKQAALEAVGHIPASDGVSLLKAVAEPVRQLQLAVASAQQQILLDARDVSISEATSLADIKTEAILAQEPPRLVASKQVLNVLEAGEASLSEKDSISALETVAKEGEASQVDIAAVEEQVPMELLGSRDGSVSEAPSLTDMKTTALSSQEPLGQIATKHELDILEAGEESLSLYSVSDLKTVAKEGKESLLAIAAVEEQLVLEEKEASLSELVDPHALGTLAKPLRELHTNVATSEQPTVLEAKGASISEATEISKLKTVAKAEKEPLKDVAVVQEQIVLEARDESISEGTNVSQLESLASTSEEPNLNVATVQQQTALEERDTSIAEQGAILEKAAAPLSIQESARGIATVTEQILLEERDNTISDKESISELKTQASEALESHKDIALAEEQFVLQAREASISETASMSQLKDTAAPTMELREGVASSEQQMLLETDDGLISETHLSKIETDVKPVHEVSHGIATAEQQTVLEAVGRSISDESEFSNLHKVASPTTAAEKALATVQQETVLEERDYSLSEVGDISEMKTQAVATNTSMKVGAISEQPAVMETMGEFLMEEGTLSELKVTAALGAEPAKDVAMAEQQQLLEQREASLSEDVSMAKLQTKADPVKEVLKGVALVEQQVVLEGREKSLVDEVSQSKLETLATAAQEQARQAAVAEQQVVLEGRETTLAEEVSVSKLQTLARPAEELHRALAGVLQQTALEEGLELTVEAPAMSALAQPLQELRRELAVMEQQLPLEQLGSQPARAATADLLTAAQAVHELREAVATAEQVALEARAGPLQAAEVLRALAAPVRHLQLAVASATAGGGAVALEAAGPLQTAPQPQPELARALAHLERDLAVVCGHQVLEAAGSDEDATLRSADLPTLASSAEVSGEMAVADRLSMMTLEGDADTLSDRTDSATAALSGAEPRLGVAAVQRVALVDAEDVPAYEAAEAVSGEAAPEAAVASVAAEAGREAAVALQQRALSVAGSLAAAVAEEGRAVEVTEQREDGARVRVTTQQVSGGEQPDQQQVLKTVEATSREEDEKKKVATLEKRDDSETEVTQKTQEKKDGTAEETKTEDSSRKDKQELQTKVKPEKLHTRIEDIEKEKKLGLPVKQQSESEKRQGVADEMRKDGEEHIEVDSVCKIGEETTKGDTYQHLVDSSVKFKGVEDETAKKAVDVQEKPEIIASEKERNLVHDIEKKKAEGDKQQTGKEVKEISKSKGNEEDMKVIDKLTEKKDKEKDKALETTTKERKEPEELSQITGKENQEEQSENMTEKRVEGGEKGQETSIVLEKTDKSELKKKESPKRKKLSPKKKKVEENKASEEKTDKILEETKSESTKIVQNEKPENQMVVEDTTGQNEDVQRENDFRRHEGSKHDEKASHEQPQPAHVDKEGDGKKTSFEKPAEDIKSIEEPDAGAVPNEKTSKEKVVESDKDISSGGIGQLEKEKGEMETKLRMEEKKKEESKEQKADFKKLETDMGKLEEHKPEPREKSEDHKMGKTEIAKQSSEEKLKTERRESSKELDSLSGNKIDKDKVQAIENREETNKGIRESYKDSKTESVKISAEEGKSTVGESEKTVTQGKEKTISPIKDKGDVSTDTEEKEKVPEIKKRGSKKKDVSKLKESAEKEKLSGQAASDLGAKVEIESAELTDVDGESKGQKQDVHVDVSSERKQEIIAPKTEEKIKQEEKIRKQSIKEETKEEFKSKEQVSERRVSDVTARDDKQKDYQKGVEAKSEKQKVTEDSKQVDKTTVKKGVAEEIKKVAVEESTEEKKKEVMASCKEKVVDEEKSRKKKSDIKDVSVTESKIKGKVKETKRKDEQPKSEEEGKIVRKRSEKEKDTAKEESQVDGPAGPPTDSRSDGLERAVEVSTDERDVSSRRREAAPDRARSEEVEDSDTLSGPGATLLPEDSDVSLEEPSSRWQRRRPWRPDDRSRSSDSSATITSSSGRRPRMDMLSSSASRPQFATRLRDRTAAAGSRLRLVCCALGSPAPALRWLKDGRELPAGAQRRYTCSCDASGMAALELHCAGAQDAGTYTCEAANEAGVASTSAELRVVGGQALTPAPPTFTRAIRDSYRAGEDELVLECRVRGSPAPAIRWLLDGRPLPLGDGRHAASELADGVCRLVVREPREGLYTCVARNDLAEESISSSVCLTGSDSRTEEPADFRRPYFTSGLSDHYVSSGATIALQVQIAGSPQPAVSWTLDGHPLRPPLARSWEEAGVHTLLLSGAATPRDAGVYSCRARNAWGVAESAARVMVAESARGVRPALFITRPDSDVSAAVGEDVSVSFRVTGEPRPRVTWSHGLRDVTHSARTLKESSDDYVRLTLKRARPTDAGTYCVLARNVYGQDRAFFTLKVRQRARSLTPGGESRLRESTEDILRNIRDSEERERRKDVPAAIAAEPVVSDQGRNWLTLTWPKGEPRSGVPVLAYRVEAWQLAGDSAGWTELGVSPINSFDAFNLKPGAEYRFRVTARNRYGWGEPVSTSAPVAVGRPHELPEFCTILPGQLKALAGQDVALECQVRGEPAPEVRWYRDGCELQESPPRVCISEVGGLCQLQILQVTEADAGRYMCDAASSVGRVSTFARVQVVHDRSLLEADSRLKREAEAGESEGVETAPQFSMRLRDRRVQVTYPVRLTCQVAGWPAPDVSWTKDGVPVTPDDGRSLQSDESRFHTLELRQAALEDSGEYCATARNAHGAVSCRATLVVDKGIRAYVAPEFVFELEPAAASVAEGRELRLRAQVEAYPAVGVMWHRDGVRLRPSRRAVMTLDHDGRVQLSLAGVTARDAGVYTCTASNAVGRAETSAAVAVHPPDADATDASTTDSAQRAPHLLAPDLPYSQEPMFLTKPRSTEAREGDTVVIQCEVVGDPKPEVFWLRDFLKPDYYRDAGHFHRQGDGPCYQLEIPHAKLDFTGAYSVVARNCHGEAKAVISLQIYARGQGKQDAMEPGAVTYGRVQTLPSVRRALADRRCCDGDAVTLECKVTATPLPDVRWEKDGRLIPLGGDFVAELDGETARLCIAHVFPEDEGQYTCVASNALGSARTSACLLVDVPEEKETLLSRQLSRPPALLSAGSTPRSTPRTTPTRSQSPTVTRSARDATTPERRPTTPSGGRRSRAAAPPRFYAVPHNRVAEEGETVRLQCACAGHPAPWTSWHRDGRELASTARLRLSERDDLRVLEIREVTREDAGVYRVTLENALGRVQASARIDVIERRGRSSSGVRAWSASPRTSPTPGRRLGPAPLLTAYHRAADPSRYSAGYYRHAAADDEPMDDEDDCESGASSPLQPVFAEPLPPVSVATEGSPLELCVRLADGQEALPVTWSREGAPLPDCSDFRYARGAGGRRSLLLRDVFPQDAGLFRCEARRPDGRPLAVSCTRLSVIAQTDATPAAQTADGRTEAAGALFVKSPAPVVARPGGSACFVARLRDARDAASAQWTVAGRSAADCPRCQVETCGDESVLRLLEVSVADAGAVRCWVPGAGEAAPATLAVDAEEDAMAAAARITRGPLDAAALRGDTVTLSAAFVGRPPPAVRWLRAGRELVAGGRLSVETTAEESRLTLADITADDSGKYVVCVANDLGEDCHFASLAVEGPPDPPAGRPSVTSLSPGAEGGVSALVAWSSAPYDGGCIVTGYSVEMRRGGDDHWTTVAESCLSLSHHVSGLSEGETYSFRVRAHNRHGASEPGAESAPFTAAPAAVRETPQLDEEEEVPEEEWDPEEVDAGGDFCTGYEVLQELGKGRYGVVHLVRHRRSQRLFAGKFLRCVKAADREKARAEVDVMRRLRHPKLLRLAAVFEAPREVVVVTEYISGGELFERVVADDFTLTERDCVLFMRQICEGVQYMHQSSVVHLDLKPENIMCRTRTSHQIKLIDFGLARILTPEKPERVLFGTPEFIPPEIINYEPIGFESDMWSVGVICYVLLSGLSPFMGDNDVETFANITRADYDFDDEAFDAISEDAKNFISELLVKRKEKRLTAEQCLQHRWLTQTTDAISCVRLCTDKLKKFIIRRKWQLPCHPAITRRQPA